MGDLRPAEPGEHPESADSDVDDQSEQESVNPPWRDSQPDRLLSCYFCYCCVHVAYLRESHLPAGRADRRRVSRRRANLSPNRRTGQRWDAPA
jgi:hypothetical protein